MSKTMAEIMAEHRHSAEWVTRGESYLPLSRCSCGGWEALDDEAHLLHVAEAIVAAGYGHIAEAAHKARRETLAEVQAHVRAEMADETTNWRRPTALSVVDSYLANLQVEHAQQDPEGRALAEGILERRASRE